MSHAPDPHDEGEISRELANVLANDADRSTALEFWQDIAAGNFHREARAFASEIAKRIVDADSESEPKKRAVKVYEATGLGGRIDRNADLRRACAVLKAFGASTPEIVGYVKREKLGGHHLDDRDLRKLIDRELAKAAAPKSPD